MKYIVILFIIIFSSCNSKNESENKYELTYLMLIKENNKYNAYLSESIQAEIRKNKENGIVLKYDNLTKEYLKYLTEIETGISKNTSEIFFKNSSYSNKGKEFINKIKNYKAEIEKLVIDKNLRKRINLTLNTNDVQIPENGNEVAESNESSDIKVGITYLKYLDYYFKGLTNNQTLAFLNNKKSSILEIENEFIENEIIDN